MNGLVIKHSAARSKMGKSGRGAKKKTRSKQRTGQEKENGSNGAALLLPLLLLLLLLLKIRKFGQTLTSWDCFLEKAVFGRLN